ncbi:hypothetical protein OSTOST_09901, partial [Ostertagia ostertagi]
TSSRTAPVFRQTYREKTYVSPDSFVRLSSSAFALGGVYDERDGNMGRQYLRVLLVALAHRSFKCRFESGTVVSGGKLYKSENHLKNMFIELNRILGVEHFVVYLSKDVSESMANVVDFYEHLGCVNDSHHPLLLVHHSRLLEVSRLKIPVKTKNIWYHGQLVAIT